ncbi:MAG: ACP S-malonyltransferase [Pseudomonadota bacterium]
MSGNSVAFVFPGQGSQSVGMLSELAADFPSVKETFAEASDRLGVDLWEMTQQGPEEALNRTENTQPAMLVAGIATWRVWRENGGPLPSIMAGHSLGEYTALVASGALDLVDGAWLVAERGRLMQQAAPPGSGAMAALLGLNAERVEAVCQLAAEGEIVAPANLNGPSQTVIAGSVDAVDRAVRMAREAGAKRAAILPVSVPCHCDLVKPAAEELGKRLEQVNLRQPQVPVLQNADVAIFQEPEQIRESLVRQLYQPVRWVETIEFLVESGTTRIVECGPGKVLSGLTRRINREVTQTALIDMPSIHAELSELE